MNTCLNNFALAQLKVNLFPSEFDWWGCECVELYMDAGNKKLGTSSSCCQPPHFVNG